MHLLSSMQFLAHGSDSVMYFQWRKSRGSSEKFHGAVVDHDQSPQNRVFKEVAQVGKALEKLSDVVATMPDSKVAILYDWESNWALADCQGYAKETKRYPHTCQAHYKAFWERDIPVDVITKEQDFSKYKILVVPMLYMMSECLMDRFRDFVLAGNKLVMTYISGVVDINDLVYMNGWPEKLQTLFGINILETDTYYPKDGNNVAYGGNSYKVFDYASVMDVGAAEVLGSYKDDFYSKTAAVTKNNFGQGEAYFIGARMEHGFQADFYGMLLAEAGITAAVEVAHDLGVSVSVREDDDHQYVFIMNFTEKVQKVELGFAAIDMITGESVTAEIKLAVYGVKVLKKQK